MGAVAIKLTVGEIFLHLSGKSGVQRREKSEEERLGTKANTWKDGTVHERFVDSASFPLSPPPASICTQFPAEIEQKKSSVRARGRGML